MLVLVLAGLVAEDHLVDAALFVAQEVLADLVGRADRAAQAADSRLDDLRAQPVLVLGRRDHGFGVVALLGAALLELVPHARDGRLMAAEHVVVRE